MTLAERIDRLGTETAFAVSAEAAAFATMGNKVYPFHLGDMNLPTPPNIIDAAARAMKDGKTSYSPTTGIPQLRDALAADINAARGTSYSAENVVIQPGGKPVIGKFIMSVMNPGDEVLYPNPGYPIYESQIEFHGGRAVPYGYLADGERFRLDMDSLEQSITPRTRVLVFNDSQNPTGAECTLEELQRLAETAIKHNLWVLCDEAYFDMRYEGEARSLTSLPGMAERCVILYTFSKKFAMTGWRLGAAIGPRNVIDAIAKLNVNDESCSNHFVQYAALEALSGDQSAAKRLLLVLKERRDITTDLLNSIDGVKCYRPNATFYLFPNVTGLMEKLRLTNYEGFRRRLLEETGVSVCTRMHFGRPLPGEQDYYIRFAYSGIDLAEIKDGLARFREFAEGAQTGPSAALAL